MSSEGAGSCVDRRSSAESGREPGGDRAAETRKHWEAVSSGEFRRACGRFATGVAIAGAIDANGVAHGLTVNSFSSVSLEPPLILICLGHAVAVIGVFREARHFGLSVLRARQREVSERFAAAGDSRFDGLPWRRGSTGAPLLDDSLARIECETVTRLTAGDHDVLIARMIAAEVETGEPLIYYASEYRELRQAAGAGEDACATGA